MSILKNTVFSQPSERFDEMLLESSRKQLLGTWGGSLPRSDEPIEFPRMACIPPGETVEITPSIYYFTGRDIRIVE